MKKLAGLVLIAALVVLLLGALAPSAPEGMLREAGEAIRAFWGNPISGP